MNIRRIISISLILLLLRPFLIPVPLAEASVSLTAPSALLLEPGSQKIIFSRAPHRKQPPASTAKIVTALVVLDSLPLDRWVTISPRVEKAQASKLYLRGGDQIRVRDLLKAILIKSANDAAQALAIAVSGSERAFADVMTEKARRLGAHSTRFVNASGLPEEGQYSTAYDLAILMQAALRNEVIISILRQRNASIRTASGRRYHLKSHNKMLLRGERVIGKTGYTQRAKYCFVGFIEEGSRNIIVSVLGSKKLWRDLTTLLNQVNGGARKTLSFGSRGDAVKQLQAALKKLGFFNGPTTGYFGKITKRALSKFQRSRGLLQDGILGPKTRTALASHL
ncbi:MAG: peptidoglycan-binding protein [Candidatus Omnitrophica bacterium]|nr:peptidoglycan-binding protein [Candidatus Omnitrophota bacterium]